MVFNHMFVHNSSMITFRRNWIIGFLFLLLYLVTSLIIISYYKHFQIAIISTEDNTKMSELSDSTFAPFQGERTIHLDLKGAPPSIDYLTSIFPLFHDLGVTSLLIEYEDVFPYNDVNLRAVNAYSKNDLETLLRSAEENNLNVIPLVQTFGHLEFLLKLKKYAHLREKFEHPQSICPSHNDTFPILTGLLDEVINAHPHIRYIHIGCDEVYELGLCQKCRDKMFHNHWQNDELFLDHVSRLAKYICLKYPSITPLMWDDQLRSISIDTLRNFNIETLIEPVIWFYRPVVSLPVDLWEKYSKVFPTVWIASCFKGATGSDKIITNANYHVKNQISWMRVMRKYAKLINFKGVIITGWQRYDHFAILCELLPVSVPSLVHVALILDGSHSSRKNISQKIENVTACGTNNDVFESCEFPGVNIYFAILRFSQLRTEIDDILSSSAAKGWLTAYNIKTKYFNRLLAENLLGKIEKSQNSLKGSKAELRRSLKMVYDVYTVSEWIEINVQPYASKLIRTSSILRNLVNITEWGPRYGDLISK